MIYTRRKFNRKQTRSSHFQGNAFIGAYHINYSELESKYVGQTLKNIRRVFECATRDDAVLIFDEAVCVDIKFDRVRVIL